MKVLLFTFCCVICSYVGQVENQIIWNKYRKLKYIDFRNPAPKTQQGFAGTVTFIKPSFDIDTNSNAFSYDVYCYFDTYFSFIKIDDSGVLVHEQGHFDLTEICTRKLKHQFYVHQDLLRNAKEVYKLIQSAYDEDAAINNLYDNDVENDVTKQIEWTAKIKATLDSLAVYADHKGVISLK